jgi:hypothetical protein
MALARVVTFDSINPENVARIKEGVERGDVPEGMPPAEFLFLHDESTGGALVIVLVDNDEDYRRADEIMGSVPADEAAGRRTSVTRYQVAIRASTK